MTLIHFQNEITIEQYFLQIIQIDQTHFPLKYLQSNCIFLRSHLMPVHHILDQKYNELTTTIYT